MGYNLFLDDERTPISTFRYTQNGLYVTEKWEIIRNFYQFISFVSDHGIPTIVSFDHDLGDVNGETEKTGYHCATWLIDHCINENLNLPKIILVHSMNTVGNENIRSLFNDYKKIFENGSK